MIQKSMIFLGILFFGMFFSPVEAEETEADKKSLIFEKTHRTLGFKFGFMVLVLFILLLIIYVVQIYQQREKIGRMLIFKGHILQTGGNCKKSALLFSQTALTFTRCGFGLLKEGGVMSMERVANIHALLAAKAFVNNDSKECQKMLEKVVDALAANKFLLDPGLLQVLPFIIVHSKDIKKLNGIVSQLHALSETLEFTPIESSELYLSLALWHYRSNESADPQIIKSFIRKIHPQTFKFLCKSVQFYTLYNVHIKLLQYIVRDVTYRKGRLSHRWEKVRNIATELLETLQYNDYIEYSNSKMQLSQKQFERSNLKNACDNQDSQKANQFQDLNSKMQLSQKQLLELQNKQRVHILLLMWWLNDKLFDRSPKSSQYTQRLKFELQTQKSSLRDYFQSVEVDDMRQGFITSQRMQKLPAEKEVSNLLEKHNMQYFRQQDILYEGGKGTLSFIPNRLLRRLGNFQHFDSFSVELEARISSEINCCKCEILWVNDLEELCKWIKFWAKCSSCPHLPVLLGVTQNISEDGDFAKWGLVMEDIQGITLHEFIYKRKKEVDMISILRILKSVCRALACLHEEHVVHAEIDMHNIYVTKQGCVKIRFSQSQVEKNWQFLDDQQLGTKRDLLQFASLMFTLLYPQNNNLSFHHRSSNSKNLNSKNQLVNPQIQKLSSNRQQLRKISSDVSESKLQKRGFLTYDRSKSFYRKEEEEEKKEDFFNNSDELQRRFEIQLKNYDNFSSFDCSTQKQKRQKKQQFERKLHKQLQQCQQLYKQVQSPSIEQIHYGEILAQNAYFQKQNKQQQQQKQEEKFNFVKQQQKSFRLVRQESEVTTQNSLKQFDFSVLTNNTHKITKSISWKLLKILKYFFVSDARCQNFVSEEYSAISLAQIFKEIQQSYINLEIFKQKEGRTNFSQNINIKISNILDAIPSAIVSHLSVLDEIMERDQEEDVENKVEYEQLGRNILSKWQDMSQQQLQSVLIELKTVLRMVEEYNDYSNY